MGLQLVSVIGNATKDAETKTSKDGASYVAFRLAASNDNEATTFYNILVFGKYGEVMREYITRGRQVFVNGKVQVSEKGYISVIADHIELLTRPKPKGEKAEKEEERGDSKSKRAKKPK